MSDPDYPVSFTPQPTPSNKSPTLSNKSPTSSDGNNYIDTPQYLKYLPTIHYYVLIMFLVGKPAYRFQSQESSGASYIQAFFLGQLNGDLFLQHPAAVSTILTLLGSSRDISSSLQHSIIKIIHGTSCYLLSQHLLHELTILQIYSYKMTL